MQSDGGANNRGSDRTRQARGMGFGTGGGMRNLRRILIVDDDAALRQSLAEQLELHAEFASLECDSATAALGIMRQERFDAVLLDVGLPDMDGHALCREMRPEFAELTPLATIATHSGPAGGTVYTVYIARGFRGDGRPSR